MEFTFDANANVFQLIDETTRKWLINSDCTEITTHDPKSYPLPSWELLMLRYPWTRVLQLCSPSGNEVPWEETLSDDEVSDDESEGVTNDKSIGSEDMDLCSESDNDKGRKETDGGFVEGEENDEDSRTCGVVLARSSTRKFILVPIHQMARMMTDTSQIPPRFLAIHWDGML